MTKDWQLDYHDLATGPRSYGQESLLALGNGYLGWRGAPLTTAYSDDHYPGLYVAGIFNQTSTPIEGRNVINEDLVNFPNPLRLKLFVDGKELTTPYDRREVKLLLAQGLLIEHFEYPVAKGRLTLKTVRTVDPKHYHQLGAQILVQSDFNAQLRVQFMTDGTTENKNVARYRQFHSREYQVQNMDQGILQAQTLKSQVALVVGAKTQSDDLQFSEHTAKDQLIDEAEVALSANQAITFNRVAVIATSYEMSDPLTFVKKQLATANFRQIKEHSEDYWRHYWQAHDLVLDSDTPDLQWLLRLNRFHLRQAAQHQANRDLDASVGSRGLTGEGYRGHIFWDELLLIPYYATTQPQTARDLLQYRLKRLDAAKANAKSENEAGAMYPWQSAMYGDEQSQLIHLNPISHDWDPDNSRLQRHVSLAVVYNIWNYTRITGQYDVLNDGGLAVLLETTKFWLHKVSYDGERYHLSGVMGPDEFHEAYPGAKQSGLTDNAYTNLMLAWSLDWLLKLAHDDQVNFAQICAQVGFDDDLLAKANAVAHKLALNINADGVIEQYQGYFDLKRLDFGAYAKKYGDIHRIDRILKANGENPDDYQANKQADTLMAVYNLGEDKVAHLIQQLGYNLPQDWLTQNQRYYLARTVHGSTMSRSVYGMLDELLGKTDEALDFLTTAIKSDYEDIQGGTTAEGIHTGVMGSVLYAIEYGFAGISYAKNQLNIDPHLPKSWHKLQFNQLFQGVHYQFSFADQQLAVNADHNVTIKVQNQPVSLQANQEKVVSLA